MARSTTVLVALAVGAAAQVVHVEDYGAKGDGKFLNTAAFQAAFEASRAVSGGSVVVGPGLFLSGPIAFTASHQALVLGPNATVKAAWDAYGHMQRDGFRTTWPRGPKDPEGRRGDWDDQYAPLIYASGLANVSVGGGGTIDGYGEAWWRLKDKHARDKFPAAMKYQRPFTIRFDFVTGGRVSDLTVWNTPFWGIVPYGCAGIVVEDVDMMSPGDSPMSSQSRRE